jgi:hypothetical protein
MTAKEIEELEDEVEDLEINGDEGEQNGNGEGENGAAAKKKKKKSKYQDCWIG